MEKKRWQRVENIIDQALQLQNSKEQEHYIKRTCSNDKQLLREVMKLYEAINEARENNFLEI